MATLVPDQITALSLEELLQALHAGYIEVLGEATDSAACLAALGAQLALESGRGKHAHCFNWGNEKLPKDWDGLYCQFTCDEIFDPQTAANALRLGAQYPMADGSNSAVASLWKGGPLKRVVLHPPHPWSSFVAFESAEKGAVAYVEFLSLKDRYRNAWHFAYVGDAAGFSHALHQAGYYTADEDAYTRGLVSLAKELLPICQRIIAGEDHTITDADRERIMGLVALTVSQSWANDNDTAPAAVA